MPAMIFPATCAACGEPRKFIEFKVEGCSPDSDIEKRYGFRCITCKTIIPEVTASDGARHTWIDGKHVTA